MRLRYLLLALTAAALMPLASGCGGSDAAGQAGFAEARMSLAKYAEKTDLICGNGSIRQGELAGRYLEGHPGAEEIDMVIPAMVPPIEKEITELHELGLPQGHEKQAEAFLGEMEAALAALKEDPRGLSQKNNPFAKSNELGEELGLGDCSKNP